MNGIELERKFLVTRLPPGIEPEGGSQISQGYLAIGQDGSEVRVRRRRDRTALTAKQGRGLVRREEEIEIPRAHFERLWPLTEGRRVLKRRHEITLQGGLLLELDVYEGALRGLLTAEIEFPSLAAAERFVAPAWLGREVTDDDAYKNRQLAAAGLPDGHVPADAE
ncbi:MAG: adenylate cyclase [Solirubrobacteraceae bacterium]|jgi:adenylate cyclase